MSGVRLTDTRARRLKPSAREYSVQDRAVPSLNLRVYPTGTKTWTCTVGGRKVSLGRIDLMPVDDARRECLRLQIEGVAPRRDLPTYRAFAMGLWRATWSTRCKPTTVRGRDHALTRQLLPAFGALRLDRITRKAIEDWFDAYSTSAPGGANHALRIAPGDPVLPPRPDITGDLEVTGSEAIVTDATLGRDSDPTAIDARYGAVDWIPGAGCAPVLHVTAPDRFFCGTCSGGTP